MSDTYSVTDKVMGSDKNALKLYQQPHVLCAALCDEVALRGGSVTVAGTAKGRGNRIHNDLLEGKVNLDLRWIFLKALTVKAHLLSAAKLKSCATLKGKYQLYRSYSRHLLSS